MSETPEYKQGDKVRCVNPGPGLEKDGVYTVDCIYGSYSGDQFIYVEGVTGLSPYRSNRFEAWHPEEVYEARPCETEGEQDVYLQPAHQAILENCLAAEAEGLVQADMVTMPKHYARFKIEPIRFICENNLNFFQGNIVKYTLRHDAKNGLEDLRKAKRYLEMFIRFQEGDPDWWR